MHDEYVCYTLYATHVSSPHPLHPPYTPPTPSLHPPYTRTYHHNHRSDTEVDQPTNAYASVSQTQINISTASLMNSIS